MENCIGPSWLNRIEKRPIGRVTGEKASEVAGQGMSESVLPWHLLWIFQGLMPTRPQGVWAHPWPICSLTSLSSFNFSFSLILKFCLISPLVPKHRISGLRSMEKSRKYLLFLSFLQKRKFLLRLIYSISLGNEIATINKIIFSCASKAQSICEIKMQMEIIK